MKLKKLGVDYIRLSDDIFHSNCSIELTKVRNLKQYESKETSVIKFLVQDKFLKIGNAKLLDEEYIEKRSCMKTDKNISMPYLFLDVNGYV